MKLSGLTAAFSRCTPLPLGSECQDHCHCVAFDRSKSVKKAAKHEPTKASYKQRS